MFRVGTQQLLRQSPVLPAKDEIGPVGIGNVAVHPAGFGGKIIAGRALGRLQERLQVFMVGDVQVVPVVQAGALELGAVGGKPQGDVYKRQVLPTKSSASCSRAGMENRS